MNIIDVLLIGAVVFGLCFLADKCFTRMFRSKPQHMSGLSVRLNKRYGTIGTILIVLGAAAILNGFSGQWLLLGGGILVLAVGIGLVVYYMTFGIYYDDDGFLLASFGKKTAVYGYHQIKAQQLFNSYGGVLIELYLTDGRCIQLQSGMIGVYPFLDKAFEGWLRQKGRTKEDCPFHDPANSCWFPNLEV